jgi:predicted metallopeptidase
MKFGRYLNESITQTWVEDQYKLWAKKVWGENAFKHINKVLSFTTNRDDLRAAQGKGKSTALMALIHPGKGGKAISSILISIPQYIKIYISNKMLELDDKEKALKIIKHEVIHIGYSKHDKNFRDMCKKYGAATTEVQAEEEPAGYELQIRIKPRKYVTIEKFDDYDKAIRRGKAILRDKAELKKIKEKFKVQDEQARLSVKG